MRKHLIVVALAVAAAGLARFARAQTPTRSNPLRVAPDTHKLAFENQFVRVLDVHVPPARSSRATGIPTG